MKHVSDIRELDRETLRKTIRKMKGDVKRLDELRSNIDRPDYLVAEFRKLVGDERAECVIASLINGCAWDGRICPACRNWAASVPDAWDEDAMREWGIDTKMHRAHLDQTGWYARKIRG